MQIDLVIGANYDVLNKSIFIHKNFCRALTLLFQEACLEENTLYQPFFMRLEKP
jgi:hypothetical protein